MKCEKCKKNINTNSKQYKNGLKGFGKLIECYSCHKNHWNNFIKRWKNKT